MYKAKNMNGRRNIFTYTSEITRQTTSMTQRMTIVTWLTPSKLAPISREEGKIMHMLITQ